MSVPLETVRARTEEIRTRIQSRLASLRGGGATPAAGLFNTFSNFSSPELLKGPLITEARTAGILAMARARMEKFRGTTPGPAPPAPAAAVTGPSPTIAPIKGTIYT